jgi:hypothetical protein
MTAEDVRQELERNPFVPLRLHVASGQVMDIPHQGTAWVRQNTLLIVHPLQAGSAAIGGYDVIGLRLIERIEQISEGTSGLARAG